MMKLSKQWELKDENNLCYVNIGRAIKTIKPTKKKLINYLTQSRKNKTEPMLNHIPGYFKDRAPAPPPRLARIKAATDSGQGFLTPRRANADPPWRVPADGGCIPLFCAVGRAQGGRPGRLGC